MPTPVKQHLYVTTVFIASAVPHQNDRFAPQPGTEKIACIADLAFMADIKPALTEQPFHFDLEDGGIGIDPPMHPAGLHQAFDAIIVCQFAAPFVFPNDHGD